MKERRIDQEVLNLDSDLWRLEKAVVGYFGSQ
jgi:hypothetical protein